MLQNEKFYISPTKLVNLEFSDKSEIDFIFTEIFHYQVYNHITEMKIKQGDVVIDIGAHIGIYSRYAAHQGASRVISMEMEPKFFSCLRLNVRPEDDIFNCVVLDKPITQFKLENDLSVTGFSMDYFLEGGLFKTIDFLKIDVSGKEQILINSFSKKLFDVINKMSIKFYNLNDVDKTQIIFYLKSMGFSNIFNIFTPRQNIQFLYFWK